jgi:hypothetical protein
MQPFSFNAPINGKDQRKQAIIQQIMGNGAPAPSNMGQGMAHGANSLMAGLALRKHNQGAFPAAPGGGKANFLTGLMNMFGNNGGLS